MIKTILEKGAKFIEGNRLSGIIVAIIAFIFVFLLSLSAGYERFDLNLYDLSFTIKPRIMEWDRLAFIDIDDNTTNTLGQYPLPRRLYGQALRALKEAGVAQYTMDIMFFDSSPLQVPGEEYEKLMEKMEKKNVIDSDEIRQSIMNNDQIFAEGVSSMGRVILAYNLSTEPPVQTVLTAQKKESFMEAQKRFLDLGSQKVKKEDHDKYSGLMDEKTKSISYPIPELMTAARNFGFVNRDPDIDGAMRKVRLVQFFDGRLFFNMALVMLADACGVSVSDIVVEPGRQILLPKALNPMTLNVEDISIPIDSHGMLYVNWAGPGKREESFRTVSFYAVVEYFDFVDMVYEFFDNQGGPEGAMERGNISQEIDKARRGMALAKSAPERQALQKKVSELTRRDLDIKKGYARVLDDEIKRIEEDLKRKDDKKLRGELAALKNDKKAVDLILWVEGLRDSLALTSWTATGTTDIGRTPTSNEYARVGTYHNTVNTILQRKFIRLAPAWLNYLLMLAVALLMGYSIQRMNARTSIITIVASFIALNAAVISVFVFGNLWMDQLGLSLALIIPSSSIAAIKFMREETQKRFIKNAFSHYLAPGVIDKIMEHPEALELGGEEREISIFFSDVAGFSTISEKLTPPQLVSLLNEYLSEMTDIILKHGGTIDKYEGDAIMAFFGAPHPFPDHALRCCMAAIEQKKRLRELQELWRREGRNPLTARMGMNTGRAVVGNMGSRTRMDYTAMGDSVNLASRLEGANKFYQTHAMISQATYDGAKEAIDARRLDIIRVVGKTQPIMIYELLGPRGSMPGYMYEMLEIYYRGLDLFSEHQWRKARTVFKEALKIVKDDGPCLTYVNRCEEFMKKPPSRNWDGVYTFKSK
jgi:adenylate cyclase